MPLTAKWSSVLGVTVIVAPRSGRQARRGGDRRLPLHRVGELEVGGAKVRQIRSSTAHWAWGAASGRFVSVVLWKATKPGKKLVTVLA